MPRRDLERKPGFADVSPDIGQLSEQAFDQLWDDDPEAALELLAAMAQATDAVLAGLARRLAGRLILSFTTTSRSRGRGTGRPMTVRARPDSSDLDVDTSLEALIGAMAAGRSPSIEELTARQWSKAETAICLLIDRSGSMNGERLASAALAAAVCSWRAPEEFAVLAFADKVIEIKALNQARPAEDTINDILALRGHGTTDIALALGTAASKLAGAKARRRITFLLSDAESTTGPDPVEAGRGLDELIVIAPEDEPEHADALARALSGRMIAVAGPLTVVEAINRLSQ